MPKNNGNKRNLSTKTASPVIDQNAVALSTTLLKPHDNLDLSFKSSSDLFFTKSQQHSIDRILLPQSRQSSLHYLQETPCRQLTAQGLLWLFAITNQFSMQHRAQD